MILIMAICQMHSSKHDLVLRTLLLLSYLSQRLRHLLIPTFCLVRGDLLFRGCSGSCSVSVNILYLSSDRLSLQSQPA